MFIGNVEIKGFAALAPMAGVADRAFRELCTDFGASYTVTEMVSSKGLEYKSEKTEQLMQISDKERPCGVQLFGNDPKTMALAAEKALEYAPDFIDINMGCPAPKVSGNGCGSALMKNPTLCGEIVKAVSSAVEIPVTVKIRKGWDENSVNAVEVAKICEANGAAAVAVHGRTRSQQYQPPVDWNIIKQVKNAVKIPVIGNGDVISAEDAQRMYEQTGCDFVMIGRGALGNPWIFLQIDSWFENEKQIPNPTIEQRLSVMLRHIKLVCDYKGEEIAIREARKHVGWYLKGFHGASTFRKRACSLKTFAELESLVAEVYRQYLC